MKAGKGSDAVGGLVHGLKTYTVTHFTAEERELKRINYPDYLGQKKQHEAFVAKLAEFQQKLTEGKTNLSIEMMNFLKEWLSTHIQGSDKKYGPFFAKVSVK